MTESQKWHTSTSAIFCSSGAGHLNMVYRASSSGFAHPPSHSTSLLSTTAPSALASAASANLKHHPPSIFRMFAQAGFMCLGHLSSSLKKELLPVYDTKFLFACSVHNPFPFLRLKCYVWIWFSNPFLIDIGLEILSPVGLSVPRCGLLGQDTGASWEQTGTLFMFIFIKMLKYPGLKPDSMDSNPDSAS